MTLLDMARQLEGQPEKLAELMNTAGERDPLHQDYIDASTPDAPQVNAHGVEITDEDLPDILRADRPAPIYDRVPPTDVVTPAPVDPSQRVR